MTGDILNLLIWWPRVLTRSILDQAAFAVGNFIFTVLLARWLTGVDFGSFSVVFSIFLLLAGLYNALLLEPMSVLGPKREDMNISGYLCQLLWIHKTMTIIVSVVLFIISEVLDALNSPLAGAFLGLSLALPFILLFWFCRRACYLEPNPGLALKSSSVYCGTLVVGIVTLYWFAGVSSTSAFIVMGLASLTASLACIERLGVTISQLVAQADFKRNMALISENWSYTKWAMGTVLVYGLSSQVYIPLIGASVGLFEAGALRAMQVLISPLQQILTAMTMLFLPWFSRQIAHRGNIYLSSGLRKLLVVNLTVAISYVFILLIFAARSVELLYENKHYDQFLWIIPYLGVTAVIGSILSAMTVALKAIRRPDVEFWSQSAGAVFSTTIGLHFVFRWGIAGAAVGVLGSTLLATFITAYLLWRRLTTSLR